MGNEFEDWTGRIERLEERLAHLLRAAEDLSEVVARQDRTIDTLERKVSLLLQREAERIAAEDGGGAVFIDKPPHY